MSSISEGGRRERMSLEEGGGGGGGGRGRSLEEGWGGAWRREGKKGERDKNKCHFLSLYMLHKL